MVVVRAAVDVARWQYERSSTRLGVIGETQTMRWPDGFMWGTGASSTQCEGASEASDWWDWERAGGAPMSGGGNGFASRYAEDFALLAELGLTHHRLSMDWARLEPDDGVHDERTVAHYRDVLHAAHDAGITPWVTLHHFTLPRWFAARGGFLVGALRERWTRHVEFVAETFGDLVGGWKPVNEANYYGMLHYGGFGFPPNGTDPADRAFVEEVILLANAEAAVRLRQTGAPVASVFGLSAAVALDDDPASAAFVEEFYGSMWDPGIGLFRDGVLRVPGRDPVIREDLVGSFDLVGFSYYSVMGARAGRPRRYPEDAPVSPLGYGICAEGVGRVLDRLHEELPGTPLLVAEYGIGTADDDQRAAYLRDGLAATADAIDRGVDVRGLFHWTAVDNYEWLLGFRPDAAFGIIDVDRTVKPSAAILAEAARSR